MRTLMIIFLGLSLFNHKCKAVEAFTPEFVEALIWAESEYNSFAKGDNGNALGILQIWPDVIRDYNRLTGATLIHTDAYEPAIAIDVCETYLLHYGAHAERKLGRSLTQRELAAIWNGGPDGWKGHKPLTFRHWKRVAEGFRRQGITPVDVFTSEGNFSVDLFNRGVVDILLP